MRRKGDEREVFFFRLAQKKGTRAERELSFSPKFLLFPLLRQRQNKEVKETTNDRGRRGFGCNEEREERKE